MGDERRLYHGDCLPYMKTMTDNTVDILLTDPPYFGVKNEDWDKQWSNAEAYIKWMGELCKQWQRIIKPNGSLYVFASPQMAARVEVKVSEYFNVLNQIVWNKSEGWYWQKKKEEARSYLSSTERIIFAEHFGADNAAKGEAGYIAKRDELRGFIFEPLREYLDNERTQAGISFEDVRQMIGCAPGSGLPSHWFTSSQWMLPTEESYKKLREGFNRNNGNKYLRREYEDLRREYEDLRRPFRVTANIPFTDVWEFRPVAAYPGKHPAEKPQALIRHIIEVSSKPGAVVFDPFMGSGAIGVAALGMGRKYIGCEKDDLWYPYAEQRLLSGIQLTLGLEE